MRRMWLSCVLLAVLPLAGCGGRKMIQPKGRVLKNGTPLVLKEDECVNIFFVPVVAAGEQHPGDVFAARYNDADGTFQATGKDGKGMPPGKYRISIEHLKKKKDLLKGAFGMEKSPFVRDIEDASTELVLDLDKPT